MSQLVISKEGKLVTDSLKIALTFQKDHRHVLDSIRNLTAENPAVKEMFVESNYLNERNQSQPMYIMNRDGFSLLAMGFTGKKAIAFKLQFIAAFNEMEEQIQSVNAFFSDNNKIPLTYSESLRMLADSKESEERKDRKIEYLEPLALVGKSFEYTDGSVRFGTFAPVIGYGQNLLYDKLRQDKILINKGERHNQPYARYKDWFEVKPCKVQSGAQVGKMYWQTRITVKGQNALIKKYQKKEILNVPQSI